jgi:menaquinone-9 beta-reductase
MNNKSEIRNPKSAIVVGAGPAGSSLAIRLAEAGLETTLIEREVFPRAKLCGEFISPECLQHFQELNVLDDILDAGGDHIRETRFFARGGRNIAVPNDWFERGSFALSLSRAVMDNTLLRQAREVGVAVLEGTSVASVERDDRRVRRLGVRGPHGEVRYLDADIFVDATGRSQVLTKMTQPKTHRDKPAFIGFKAHLNGVDIPKGVCEMYSFDGGYAGLSNVEGNVANLCFILRSEVVRAANSDANELVDSVVSKNKRAGETLRGWTPPEDWLAVSINSFGVTSPTPLENLFTIGDAAAFIDPFTGSGMLMAMQSSSLLADAVCEGGDIAARYSSKYRGRFTSRLRVCSMLRRTAFMPKLATGIVSALSVSRGVTRYIARTTRR